MVDQRIISSTLTIQVWSSVVALGNGDGTFQALAITPIGSSPISAVDVLDLDGDGKRDVLLGGYLLVPSGRGAGTLAFMKGKGNGTLESAQTYVVAGGNTGFSHGIADFNGDGHLDVAVSTDVDNAVSVVLARGDGSFRAGRHAGVFGPAMSGVAVADFNKDGLLDVATAVNDANSSPTNVIAVSLGATAHAFSPSRTFPVGTNPSDVVSAEVNGDGNIDLLVANLGGNVSVLLGNGDGTFQAPIPYFASSQPIAIVAADLNHDGKIDFATLQKAANPTSIAVLINNGNGTFGGAVSAGNINGGYGLLVADFNGDGKPDLTTGFGVALGKGDGTFLTPSSISTSSNPSSVAVGDLNGDQKLDVLATDQSAGLITALGDGTGKFTVTSTPLPGALAVGVGDFNGDGIADAVVASSPSGSLHVILQVLPGLGGGSFGPAVLATGAATYRSAVVMDVDKDGKPDIVVSSDSGVDVFFNTSN